MLFNSFLFLGFFTALVVVYYLVPHRARWPLLLTASLYFYSTFNPAYLLLLAGATLVAYLVALALGATEEPRRRKGILAAGVAAELGALFIFKYYGFFHGSLSTLLAGPVPLLPRLELLVPVGLSFYTFSCVSYLVDVYRGHLAPQRHLGQVALYVSFFPKLLAGPIERATAFLPQLLTPVRFNAEGVSQGLQLMLWGLFKKVVIADRLAVFVDAAYQRPDFASPVDLILASYFFAFQIYCDFSGYSDIAIGAARVLGFNLMENFRRPYFSTSVPEFWGMRWHISLSRWFRDYLYIPLGGNRVARPRYYLNQVMVFLVSGLWHGANWTFVIWGGLNGLYQVVWLLARGAQAKVANAVPRPVASGPLFALAVPFPSAVLPARPSPLLKGVLTFHLVLIAWVFFRASSVSDALTVLERIARSLPSLPTLIASRPLSEDILLSIALITLLIVLERFEERGWLWQGLRTRPVYLRWAVYYVLLGSLLVIGRWNLKQFVYMQF